MLNRFLLPATFYRAKKTHSKNSIPRRPGERYTPNVLYGTFLESLRTFRKCRARCHYIVKHKNGRRRWHCGETPLPFACDGKSTLNIRLSLFCRQLALLAEKATPFHRSSSVRNTQPLRKRRGKIIALVVTAPKSVSKRRWHWKNKADFFNRKAHSHERFKKINKVIS